MTKTKDFEILGYKVTLKDTGKPFDVRPEEIVELVRSQSTELLNQFPSLDRGEAALLVALKLAEEKLRTDKEFQSDIQDLHFKADNALKALERISSTHQ